METDQVEEAIDETKQVVDKMLEIWSEEQIAHPEHEPRMFKYQVQLAKWCLNNTSTEVINSCLDFFN